MYGSRRASGRDSPGLRTQALEVRRNQVALSLRRMLYVYPHVSPFSKKRNWPIVLHDRCTVFSVTYIRSFEKKTASGYWAQSRQAVLRMECAQCR